MFGDSVKFTFFEFGVCDPPLSAFSFRIPVSYDSSPSLVILVFPTNREEFYFWDTNSAYIPLTRLVVLSSAEAHLPLTRAVLLRSRVRKINIHHFVPPPS